MTNEQIARFIDAVLQAVKTELLGVKPETEALVDTRGPLITSPTEPGIKFTPPVTVGEPEVGLEGGAKAEQGNLPGAPKVEATPPAVEEYEFKTEVDGPLTTSPTPPGGVFAPDSKGVASPTWPRIQNPLVELDTAGKPWDVRIHVSTKTKMKSGVWKVKPGTPPELVESVRNETPAEAPAPTLAGPAKIHATEPRSVPELAQYIADKITDGSTTQTQVDAALTELGVKQLTDYTGHEHMIAALVALIDAHGT